MAESERLNIYLPVDTIIELAKAHCGIEKPSPDMADEEIAKIMRFLASGAPDTIQVDGKYVYGRIGIGIMLSLTLYEFPDFYVKYELWQRN